MMKQCSMFIHKVSKNMVRNFGRFCQTRLNLELPLNKLWTERSVLTLKLLQSCCIWSKHRDIFWDNLYRNYYGTSCFNIMFSPVLAVLQLDRVKSGPCPSLSSDLACLRLLAVVTILAGTGDTPKLGTVTTCMYHTIILW